MKGIRMIIIEELNEINGKHQEILFVLPIVNIHLTSYLINGIFNVCGVFTILQRLKNG